MKTLDIIGIIIYFVLVFYVGLRASKKVKSSEDYLLAGRSLGKIQSGLSLAATDFGGSGLVGAAAYCYVVGMSGIWWNWCAVPAFFLVGLFVAPKLRTLALYSAPQFLENRYNSESRLIASSLHILGYISGLAAQLVVAATAIHVLAGVNETLALIISATVIVIYTLAGGLRAVVNTDVLQFAILILAVLISVPVAVSNIGGISELKNAVPPEFLSLGELGFWEPASWIAMCVFGYATSQSYLQRALGAKDASTARFSFVFTAGFFLIIAVLVGVMGISASVLMPNLESSQSAVVMLIKNYIPSGLSGLVLGGLFAAAMSTADSQLMGVTTIFTVDIYKRYINKNASDEKVLRTSRIFVVLISVFSIIVSLYITSIVKLIYIGTLVYSAGIFYPLVIGLFWKRGNGKGALACIAVAFVVSMLSEFVWLGNVSGFLGWMPSMFTGSTAGLVAYIIVSLLTPAPDQEKISFLNLESNEKIA